MKYQRNNIVYVREGGTFCTIKVIFQTSLACTMDIYPLLDNMVPLSKGPP